MHIGERNDGKEREKISETKGKAWGVKRHIVGKMIDYPG